MVVVLAGLAGLVLTLGALRQPTDGRPVAVAARDLDPGVPLRAGDVRFVAVRADDELLSHLVARGRPWRGRVVTVGTPAGAPLMAHRVRVRVTDGLRAMSIPVARARAVGGRLVRGDRVDVVVARDGTATVVVAGIEVLDVGDDGAGAFGSGRDEITITLAVDVPDSQRLAAVLADGDFVLTRVTGAVSAAGAPPVALQATDPNLAAAE
jgi:Flp pilus assembly protein CpaB